MRISLVGFSAEELVIGQQLCEREGHLVNTWTQSAADANRSILDYLQTKEAFLDHSEVLILRVTTLEAVSFLLTALRRMLVGEGPAHVIAISPQPLDVLLSMGEPPEIAGLEELRMQGRFAIYGDWPDGLSTALQRFGSAERR